MSQRRSRCCVVVPLRIVPRPPARYVEGMSKSWLPKGAKSSVRRSSGAGRFVTTHEGASGPSTTINEARSSSASPSGAILLRNGTVIKTVRKDVLERALGVGEFRKK
jgi:hypothetical protein